MTGHTAHDAHIYADDGRCICVTDSNSRRCGARATQQDGLCDHCRDERVRLATL